MRVKRRNVIGLIPAAGKGKRLGPLPCSKELFPVGFKKDAHSSEPRAKAAVEYLLEKFRSAGLRQVLIVIREEKWDIAKYLGEGKNLDLNLAYMVIRESCGPPDTLDRAYRFVEDKIVAFGFPDILFTPDHAFEQLLQRQEEVGADVVLGVLPAHDYRSMDMVRLDTTGRVTEMVLKPTQTDLHYAWICAVWTPTFTEFLHHFVSSDEARLSVQRNGHKIDPQGDLPVGAVIEAAIKAGLRVEGVPFPTATYIDIGTPDNLAKAIKLYR